MSSIDIQKTFLDNALRYYTNPPEPGVLEIGVSDPTLLKRLADKMYQKQMEENPNGFSQMVRPGHKPYLYLRWAYRQAGLTVNFELQADENRIGFTALGTF